MWTLQLLVYSLAGLSSAYPTSGGLYYWFVPIPHGIPSLTFVVHQVYMTTAPRSAVTSAPGE